MNLSAITPASPKLVVLKVNGAAFLLYYGFRLLGASKKHAWDRAQVVLLDAIIDKGVEMTGILNPKHKGKAGIQVSLEGGAHDRDIRFVDDCDEIRISEEDGSILSYRRTDRMRGQSIIFAVAA